MTFSIVAGIICLLLVLVLLGATVLFVMRWEERQTMGKDNYRYLKEFQKELATFKDLSDLK